MQRHFRPFERPNRQRRRPVESLRTPGASVRAELESRPKGKLCHGEPSDDPKLAAPNTQPVRHDVRHQSARERRKPKPAQVLVESEWGFGLPDARPKERRGRQIQKVVRRVHPIVLAGRSPQADLGRKVGLEGDPNPVPVTKGGAQPRPVEHMACLEVLVRASPESAGQEDLAAKLNPKR